MLDELSTTHLVTGLQLRSTDPEVGSQSLQLADQLLPTAGAGGEAPGADLVADNYIILYLVEIVQIPDDGLHSGGEELGPSSG